MVSKPDEEEDSFAIDLVAFLLSAVLAVWAVYTTFIVMGALLSSVFDRGELRFAGALILALIIPITTAMGANSRKEGARGIQRFTRVAIGASILSVGCAAIVALTMADKVVPRLEADPNWFLDNPDSIHGTPGLNRRYSGIIAQMSCRVAGDAGLYYCPEHIGR